jgi:pectate lyase
MRNAAGLFTLSLVLLSAYACAATAQVPPVFLGANGFGADTPAGRGGKVIRVTNLDAEGPGSVRAALEADGPRIVVFEVGGVINLEKKDLVISAPFVTLAGHTAPSPGITVIRGSLLIQTHDVLIQHIRVRPGDAGEPKRSGWEPDGIAAIGRNAHNIVIDHCSISWAVDENVSVSGPRTEGSDATAHKITLSNCIIAEGLNKASHSKGSHSKGALVHDFCKDIAVIGNLYAHNAQRNPYFKAHTTGVIVNNLIYNPGSAAIQLDYVSGEWRGSRFEPRNCRVSIVGNVLIHGRDTRRRLALVSRRGDAYLEDNVAFDRNGGAVAVTAGNIRQLEEKPVWPEGLNALPSKDVIEYIVNNAGARPKDRDDVDERIVRQFLNREGGIIDSQDEVGGYPDTAPSTRKLEVPEGNIGEWLSKFASDLE